MVNEDRPIEGLDQLKAPSLSSERRRRLRERIMARAEPVLARRRRMASSWEVLAGWARPGLAAAAILIALVTAAVQIASPPAEAPTAPQALDELLRQTDEHGRVPTVLLTSSEPDADAVVAAAFTRNASSRQPGN